MARSDLELGYRLLEACIHGGQVSGRQLAQMMRGDPKFAEWLRARASARPKAPTFSERLAATFSTQATAASSASLVAEYTSLISLAAWLHRASKEAEAAADAIGAARLAQASAVVKQAADRERQEQSVPAVRPIAANEG